MVFRLSPPEKETVLGAAVYISKNLHERLSKSLSVPAADTDAAVEAMTAVVYLQSSPAHLEYVSLEKRRNSLIKADWNTFGKNIPLESVCEAGFFHTGDQENRDHVKCFFCNLGLTDWTPGDDPAVEHVRFSPLCFFMKSCRGMDYLKRILHDRTDVLFPRSYQRRDHGGLLTRLVQIYNEPKTQAAITVGFHNQDVLMVICRRWIRERFEFDSSKALVEELQKQMDKEYETGVYVEYPHDLSGVVNSFSIYNRSSDNVVR